MTSRLIPYSKFVNRFRLIPYSKFVNRFRQKT